ncbi:unnamed protein product [Linum trigynum]|uniref:Uncharacterized protein n=1 Tax=Linum trigynum TaxID=586398 RepID=A0AAV2FXN0_9ROSI
MLAADNGEIPAPMTALPPSDRPPDTSPSPDATKILSTQTGGSADGNSSAMIIDSTSSSQQPLTSSTPPQQFSYANAVTGWKLASTVGNETHSWTPVGENDLIPGLRNGEPALKVSDDFKNKIGTPCALV